MAEKKISPKQPAKADKADGKAQTRVSKKLSQKRRTQRRGIGK